MLRVAPQRVFHNPKRQRGIALLTVRTGHCVLAHDAESGDEVDSLIEDSAEESLADASGYERSRAAKPIKRYAGPRLAPSAYSRFA